MKSILSDKKIKFYLECLKISERQFENLNRFQILMLQISSDIFKTNDVFDTFLSLQIKLEANHSYFFEKMDLFFNFQKNNTLIEKRINDLIESNFFGKDYFSLAYREDFMNGIFIDKEDDYKAYVIFIYILKDLIESNTISFKKLNFIIEKLFCPIQNISSEHIRIHAVLEEHVLKISKLVLKRVTSPDDTICWH